MRAVFLAPLFLACAVPVEIPFVAQVADSPWSCGESYNDVGTSASSIQPKDFRLYVHDVRLNGELVALVDSAFQKDGVVLLDFEDASGECTGDARLNTSILGEAAAATGELSFKLGVPFEQNHQDAETAAAPLDVAPLFWSWNAGYKFVRIDHTTTGLATHSFHLGSTGCEADEDGEITRCANDNRLPFAFTLAEGDSITLDIAELFIESDLDVNTPETPPGCLSGPTDPECESIFDNLSNLATIR